jgi:hypothetical protein
MATSHQTLQGGKRKENLVDALGAKYEGKDVGVWKSKDTQTALVPSTLGSSDDGELIAIKLETRGRRGVVHCRNHQICGAATAQPSPAPAHLTFHSSHSPHSGISPPPSLITTLPNGLGCHI